MKIILGTVNLSNLFFYLVHPPWPPRSAHTLFQSIVVICSQLSSVCPSTYLFIGLGFLPGCLSTDFLCFTDVWDYCADSTVTSGLSARLVVSSQSSSHDFMPILRCDTVFDRCPSDKEILFHPPFFWRPFPHLYLFRQWARLFIFGPSIQVSSVYPLDLFRLLIHIFPGQRYCEVVLCLRISSQLN